jgi:hypothetical protein
MKQPKVRMSVSLPLALTIRIEDINANRVNRGYTAMEVNTFMSELITLGFEVWEERNSRKYVSGMDLKKLFDDFDKEFLGKRKPLLKITH